MEKEKLMFDEAKLANMLREEILNNSQSVVEVPKKRRDAIKFEYISTQKQPYISPILTMNEDQVLEFVEKLEVTQLAKLSVAELNYIGGMLGVEPSILLGEHD